MQFGKNQMNMRIILFAVLVTMSPMVLAQELTKKQLREIDAIVSSQGDLSSPGAAVGIVSGGAIVYESYVGLANMEFQIPMGKETKINIASNAKQFTAFCIMTLIEEGKLSLEDDFRKYVPDILTEYEENITILHLLSHSSGIRDYYDLLGFTGEIWWAIAGFDNEQAMDILKGQKELNFRPGTQYLYSNSNYTLLTEVVARITGQDFASYAQEIFAKLGMDNTLFQTNYMAVMPNKARPYANWGEWMEYPAITHPHGDGGLFSTLPDQLRWEQILQQGMSTDFSNELLSMSQQPIEGAAIQRYGYGLEYSTYKGIPIVYHDGGTGAYKASMIRFPAQKLAIVAMGNSGQLSSNYLVRQIAEIILDPTIFSIKKTAQGPLEISPMAEINEALGLYQHQDGSLVGFVLHEGEISWKVGQNRAFPMEQVEGNLFRLKEQNELHISFHLEQDQAYMMVYYPGSIPRRHEKSVPIDKPEAFFTAAEGKYYNSELEIEAMVTYDSGNSYQVSVGDDNMEAIMLFEDRLEMEGYSLIFVRDESGNLTEILLGSDRVKNLKFSREE